MSKGLSTIEELRRAVETLKRNDRRTRARLDALESAESEWIRLADLPTNTCEPIAFGSLFKLPTDSTATTPPRAAASGVRHFLGAFFSRFKRSTP